MPKGNKKFDIDLKYGQEREDRVVSLLMSKKEKCEVKTERDWWYKTGNIAIEIECYGKPSGLMATESDIWIHILATGDTDYCKLVFDVPKLKQIVEKFKDRTKMVGDYKAAKCVLIPLSELFITDGKGK